MRFEEKFVKEGLTFDDVLLIPQNQIYCLTKSIYQRF